MAKYRSDYIISLNINDLAASLHSIFMVKKQKKKIYFRPEAILLKEQINYEAR